jgi:hypothetical protein
LLHDLIKAALCHSCFKYGVQTCPAELVFVSFEKDTKTSEVMTRKAWIPVFIGMTKKYNTPGNATTSQQHNTSPQIHQLKVMLSTPLA